MVSVKEEGQGHKEKLNHAITLCSEAGAIFTCPDHPDVYIDLQELSSIPELVSRILEGDSEFIKEFCDKDELASYVQEALDCAELECTECAKIYGDGNSA